MLDKKLKELIGELKEKETDVQDVEYSIKSRHVEIQQKQLRVDRLNR